MKKMALSILLASLSLSFLPGCGDNTPEFNNYNCTTEGLENFRKQKGTDRDDFIKFKEECQFKRLGSYSEEWKNTVGELEWDCAFAFDINCNQKLQQARADLTAKYKAESVNK